MSERQMGGCRAWRSLLGTGIIALALLAACSGERVTGDGAGGVQIPIEVLRPEGAGPFPAVVVLHACNGANGVVTHQWMKRLVEQGYVVALPDSFTPRGYPTGVCGNGNDVRPELRRADAYLALHQLEVRADVQAAHIGLIGFSHGGWSVLTTMARDTGPLPSGAQHGFAAAVALYPFCEQRYQFRTYEPVGPLLILAGALDDWTPAAPCESLAERSAAAGLPVTIHVYPGAGHAFDSFAPPTFIAVANRGKGAHVGGVPEARNDAIARVTAFFGRWLKG